MALSSIAGASTLTNWGSIWAIVAGVITLGLVIWQIVMWRIDQHKKKIVFKLLDMGFKPLTSIAETASISEIKRVEKVLYLKLDTHVELISVFFDGIGKRPEIKDLDDPFWEHHTKAEYIYLTSPPNFKDGRCEWHYRNPFHRTINSTISIGIDYLAIGRFDGHLIFEMTADAPAVRKRHSVAIHISENMEK